MVWWFVTKKDLKKEQKKIKAAFKELRGEVVSKKEIELMIREGILVVRELTPRTPRTTPRTTARKKADKLLDKVEIMREIASMEELGTGTNDIFKEIVTIRGLCRKTCFYKYLKLVRERVARTPRTKVTN